MKISHFIKLETEAKRFGSRLRIIVSKWWDRA